MNSNKRFEKAQEAVTHMLLKNTIRKMEEAMLRLSDFKKNRLK